MHRLVYYSTNRILGPHHDLRAQIDQILASSRRNNSQVGLTGALMFSSGFFGQILEGSQDAIEATFERIQQDPRHGDVSLLEFASVDARSFGDWSMAFVGDGDGAFADWSNQGFDLGAVTGEVLLAKLRDLVSKSHRAA
jgi:hypothetical protein